MTGGTKRAMVNVLSISEDKVNAKKEGLAEKTGHANDSLTDAEKMYIVCTYLGLSN